VLREDDFPGLLNVATFDARFERPEQPARPDVEGLRIELVHGSPSNRTVPVFAHGCRTGVPGSRRPAHGVDRADEDESVRPGAFVASRSPQASR